MTMPTIEELKQVFLSKLGLPKHDEQMYLGDAICAVLDALQPVVAEAHAAGASPYSNEYEIFPTDETYAARIIAQLKGESRE